MANKSLRRRLEAGLAPSLKAALPAPLQWPFRMLWRLTNRVLNEWSDVALYLSLAWYRLLGRPYIKWYADTLDRWAAAGRDEDCVKWRRAHLADSGQEDLAILVAAGMKPHHTLHEFGVGQLRSAKWFIQYLDKGNFSGNDSSRERIKNGTDIFGPEIEPKAPTLIVNEDNTFDWLNGKKVDYIWCHAVIGHMPKQDVEDLIRDVRKIMHKDTVFLFTHDEPDHLPPGWTHARMDSRNFWYSLAFFRDLATKYGYAVDNVTELLDDKPSFRSYFRLAKLMLK
ncbi:hypothetical protein [Ferrovibrio terrae]|uniref:hypothetical protein n=1 Tax=Ferrovibrio terrae TaxID=2594003 RepID=UPI00313786B3